MKDKDTNTADLPDGQVAMTPKESAVQKKPSLLQKSSWGGESKRRVSIWQSRISWRITAAVFTTILAVQTSILIVTAKDYEQKSLDQLVKEAQTAVLASMPLGSTPEKAPLDHDKMEHIVRNTGLQGIAIYSLNLAPLQFFGDSVIVSPHNTSTAPLAYRSDDKTYYEKVVSLADMGKPYYIALKVDSSSVPNTVADYVKQSLLILFLMSGFVTSVLMLVMGQWLLEPIAVLRHNLLSAAQNPERPDIRRLKHESRDEIGVAVRIANDLIRQNAGNLKRLKTQAEDKIHKLAFFDALTGLPNRTYFIEKLDERIKMAVVGEDRRIAVMSVDIDHFKDINDSMGHEIGDRLLDAVGKRLVKALPDDSIIARASADEFVLMVVLRPEYADSSIVVDRIFASMSESVSIMQERFQVRVSIGVAHCPEDGMDARQVLKNADIALNRAKEEGRDTVRYYSQDFDRAVQQRFQLLRDLRSALDEGQLRLHYHPQFDLRSGALIGAEALLRWWRPDSSKEGGSFISPAEFIPVAEQSGLIVPIGEWVMREACRTNKMWQEKGLPPFRIAVNISGVQFHRADIVTLMESVIKETKLDPKYIELEVTESVFMENMQMAIDILNQLHKLGVELAVDDFGTGYSSLSYLRQFPIDRLKVDQSFIRNALTNADDRTITRTIITLGHSLGLKVIAEGVETSDHENFLREENCDEVQGFKYTKPLPADKFWDFALTHTRNLAKNTKLAVIEDKSA